MPPAPHGATTVAPDAHRTSLGPCFKNLERIGKLLRKRRAEGSLQVLEVQAFLLQVADDIPDEDLGIFCCPSDPSAPERQMRENLHCSFRGPDAETARKHVKDDLRGFVVLACEVNGPNGRQPFHQHGVLLLWSSSRVELFRWPLMEGFEGGPVPVGPDSPDPRFRHLVR